MTCLIEWPFHSFTLNPLLKCTCIPAEWMLHSIMPSIMSHVFVNCHETLCKSSVYSAKQIGLDILHDKCHPSTHIQHKPSMRDRQHTNDQLEDMRKVLWALMELHKVQNWLHLFIGTPSNTLFNFRDYIS